VKKIVLLLLLVCLVIFVYSYKNSKAFAWGFYGHKKINRIAVFTLPSEMMGFYKKNIDYISEHAVDPDKRRYASENEAPRHYIDIDHYGKDAFIQVPKYWNDAVKKYTEDTLNAYGIVPWWIERMMYRLTQAFKSEDVDLILHYSADIGHYIADAHVPLHTTENYNGQLTNQKGIHGFWESRIPELKSEDYDFFVGQAQYISKPIDAAWKAVKDSHQGVDSVLKFEEALNNEYPQDQKYAFENRGATLMKVYSKEYTEAYDNKIKGQVERRMREAIRMIGSAWYTCWVNAGKPDLNTIHKHNYRDSIENALLAEETKYQEQKARMMKGHAED
jgi:hypothetical protein